MTRFKITRQDKKKKVGKTPTEKQKNKKLLTQIKAITGGNKQKPKIIDMDDYLD